MRRNQGDDLWREGSSSQEVPWCVVTNTSVTDRETKVELFGVPKFLCCHARMMHT